MPNPFLVSTNPIGINYVEKSFLNQYIDTGLSTSGSYSATINIDGSSSTTYTGFTVNQLFSELAVATRIYSCEITSGGSTVRSFTPCLDPITLEPCLYDTVEQKYYYNLGSGHFNYVRTYKSGVTVNTQEALFSNISPRDIFNGASNVPHMLAVDSVKGRTVVWNQLILSAYAAERSSSVEAGGLYERDLFGTPINSPIPVGHKALAFAFVKSANNIDASWQLYFNGGASVGNYITCQYATTGTYTKIFSIFTEPSTATLTNLLLVNSKAFPSDDTVYIKNVQVFDLTLMFGAGKEPTVEQFEAMFPATYYPYCEGRLLSTYDGVKLNQLTTVRSATTGTVVFYSGSSSLIGHKYYCSMYVKKGQGTVFIELPDGTSQRTDSYGAVSEGKNNWICTSTGYDYRALFTYANGEELTNIQITDLTEMFGAGNEPTTPEAFQKLFPDDYYEYNPTGTWLPVGNSGFNSTGFNQWDEEWELGSLNVTTGEEEYNNNYIRCKNYIPVIGGSTYYFLTPIVSFYVLQYDSNKNYLGYYIKNNATSALDTNVAYIKIVWLNTEYGTTYNHDICINLSDPNRNGTYEPYGKDYLSLDFIQNLGIPNFNIWDEEWENGSMDTYAPGLGGYKIADGSGYLRSKNLIPIAPNTTYHITGPDCFNIGFYNRGGVYLGYQNGQVGTNDITSPSEACYMSIQSNSQYTMPYKHDICINKSNDLANGTYLPHGEMYRYFPHGLLSAGSVYDEITPEYVIKRVGSVDLGTLDWTKYTNSGVNGYYFKSSAVNSLKYYAWSDYSQTILCPYLSFAELGSIEDGSCPNRSIAANTTAHISDDTLHAYDSAYTDAATFKSAMSGVMLYYELETPVKVYFQNTTFNKLKGKTVRWNQIAPITNSSKTTSLGSLTFTDNRDGSFTLNGTLDTTGVVNALYNVTLIQDHKYLLKCGNPAITNGGIYFGCGASANPLRHYLSTADGTIGTSTRTEDEGFYFEAQTTGAIFNNVKIWPMIIDLTAMFGAGNEPSTPEEFEAMFPDPYYPYTAGSALTTTEWGYNLPGFNQWDESWENGSFDYTTGQPNNVDYCIRSSNYIPVVPNTDYIIISPYAADCFWYDASLNFIGYDEFWQQSATSPSNAAYLKFRTSSEYGANHYNNDIAVCISDSSQTTYQPYHLTQVTIPMKPRMRFVADGDGMLSNVTGQSWSQKTKENIVRSLKNPSTGEQLFPYGLLKAGEVEDEVTPTYAVKRVGVVDLGTLAWEIGNGDFFYLADDLIAPCDVDKINIACSKLPVDKYENATQLYSGTICTLTNDTTAILRAIVTTPYHNDAYEFRTAMQGVSLYYEMITPITVTYSNLQENIPPLLSAPININLSSITT